MKKIDSIYVLAFPIILTIGILLIPIVPNYSDHTLAANAVENTFRWYAGHIISAVAFGISLLSVHSIRKSLEDQSYRVPYFIIIHFFMDVLISDDLIPMHLPQAVL